MQHPRINPVAILMISLVTAIGYLFGDMRGAVLAFAIISSFVVSVSLL